MRVTKFLVLDYRSTARVKGIVELLLVPIVFKTANNASCRQLFHCWKAALKCLTRIHAACR